MRTILFAFNAAIVAAVVLVVFVAKWAGSEACYGFLAGYLAVGISVRIETGKWPFESFDEPL